ncbi:MAG TPA: hypothetical protein VEB66_17105 [Opitutaceae bacterium]|nr:hypothetical protein [Opitutaceae bacterium]
MSFAEFERSVAGEPAPPAALPGPVRALWLDARGEWAAAHTVVQEDASRDAAWVHAYLHRKEGDEGNAGYWYARAGRPPSRDPLGVEWARIARTLLE